ncbi:MAG: Lrp/AsnC family transcriptional regulator [Candidatus Bathyarchaeota archaeon]|nr:Lrp/AsnC family transcriptional regulator [Candidatus Bathyarchaeota archaeon]
MESLIDNPSSAVITVGGEKSVNFKKMPLNAFVFINCESPESQLACQDLMRVDGVDEVYRSFGVYDIVAKISAASLEDMREHTLKKIKRVENIKSTLTLMIVDPR